MQGDDTDVNVLPSPLPIRVAAGPVPTAAAGAAAAVLLCDPRERVVHAEVRTASVSSLIMFAWFGVGFV